MLQALSPHLTDDLKTAAPNTPKVKVEEMKDKPALWN